MPVDGLKVAPRTCGAPFCCARQKRGARLVPNISRVNNADLRAAILRQLTADLALQANAAALAHDEATNEEGRARSKYDTHSQEAAYLAEGQGKLAAEIAASLEAYAALPLPAFGPSDPIALGALIELQAGTHRIWYFLGPGAGGLDIKLEGREILVLTPQSPLGRQLLGKHIGDVVNGPGRGTGATQKIVAVA